MMAWRDILNLPLIKTLEKPILVLIIGLIITKLILVLTHKILRKSSVDEIAYGFISRVTKIICYIVIAMLVLDNFGVNTKSIITVFGLSGAAVALALKDTLSNVAGGLVLLFTCSFVKGDRIRINDIEGIVETVEMTVTTMITDDNKTITVPNGMVTTSVVINLSKEQK